MSRKKTTTRDPLKRSLMMQYHQKVQSKYKDKINSNKSRGLLGAQSSGSMEFCLLDATNHPYDDQELFLTKEIIATLWQLFINIGKYWQNMTEEESKELYHKWRIFIYNRIHFNPDYIAEYENAANVIDSLGDKAFEIIFTDPAANIAPPTTKLARTRQLISNEFIALQLSLGGFKSFGAKNYNGYFGGINKKGFPPYRITE